MKEGETMDDMLYTVPEVAEILKTNVDYVYKLQKSGLLKFLKLGRLKCRKSSLEKFLETFEGYDITDPDHVTELKKGFDRND